MFPRRHDEVQIYGTGGMILQNMKDLLQVIKLVKYCFALKKILMILVFFPIVPAWSPEIGTDWPATGWHWWWLLIIIIIILILNKIKVLSKSLSKLTVKTSIKSWARIGRGWRCLQILSPDSQDCQHLKVIFIIVIIITIIINIIIIMQSTRLPFSMMAVSAFVHLRCLIISPHNLGDDLVEALASLQVFDEYR